MILVDFEIEQLIRDGIIDADPACIQPSSVDLHLGGRFLVEEMDPCPNCGRRGPYFREVRSNRVLIPPGGFVLAQVREMVWLPAWLTMELRLRSTAGRSGLQHALAVWGDPGFNGCMTLELTNVNRFHSIELTEGDRVVQALFHRHAPCDRPYSGRYQGDIVTETPKYGGKK